MVSAAVHLENQGCIRRNARPKLGPSRADILRTGLVNRRAGSGGRCDLPLAKPIISITCPSFDSVTSAIEFLAFYWDVERSSLPRQCPKSIPPGCELAWEDTPHHLIHAREDRLNARRPSRRNAFHDPRLRLRPRPAVRRRPDLPGPQVRGPRRRADRPGRAQRRGQDDPDEAAGGHDQPDYGSLYVRPAIRVSLLRQQPDFAPDETLDGRSPGRASPRSSTSSARWRRPPQEMAEAEDDDDRDRATRRYGELHDQHRAPGRLLGRAPRRGDPRRPRVRRRPTSTAPARTFSGGQQSRLMLAKLLLESPDLMLLDEPSNHLDIETTAWLENYLARQPVGDGRRQPRPLLPRQGRHQDLGAARGQDRRLSRATTRSTGGSGPRRPRSSTARPSGRPRRSPTSKPTSASTARASGPSRPRTARRSSARIERVETMREIVGPRHGLRRGRALGRHRHRGPASSPRRTTSPCSRTSTCRPARPVRRRDGAQRRGQDRP